jgi:kumamolisin
MNNRFRKLLAALACIAVGACSGGSHGSGALPPPGSGGQTQPGDSSTQIFVYDTSKLNGATFVRAAKIKSLSVDLVPHLQNASGLLAYAQAANDPKGPNYRHFLTPAEIGARYGASESDYAAAVKYFQSAGLSVSTWPQRLLLHVTGSQAKVENALHTSFGWYRKGTAVFLAPMTAPSVPMQAHVIGATDIVMKLVAFTDHVAVRGGGLTNGMTFGYAPQQIAAAFDYTGAYAAGYIGKGITTGVIGTAGISAADVPAYKQMFRVPASATVTVVSATDANAPGNTSLGFATPPPLTPPCFDASPYEPSATCNPEDGETQLDTEQLASLAYGANLRYYLAYNPNDGCGAIGTTCPVGAGVPLQGLAEFDAEIQTAIADDTADVLSLSFGGPEDAMVGASFNASGTGITPLELAALASEGVAVFVSSGDSGAEQCKTWSSAPQPDALCVSYPSTDPNVVSVGGTNTPLNSAGQFVGALTGWGNATTGGWSGSGGGISSYFDQPPFQKGAAGVTGSRRNVPDVALDGDANTGVAVLLYADPNLGAGPFVEPVGGTSAAAPEMAAMWALVLQACKEHASCATASGAHPYRLGNPNAYFYKIYANATEYPSVFYDVLYGNNAMTCTAMATPCPTMDPGYSSGKGYDLVTGIGAPSARALIKAVVGV